MVMKTSSKTPLTAIYVAKLIKEAQFPAGVVNIVSGYGPIAGNHLAKHSEIDKIVFAGSASVAQTLKKIVSKSSKKRLALEFGGKSPVVVCDDADLDVAVNACCVGSFLNQGRCFSGSRVFVQDSIYDKFLDKVIRRAKTIRLGAYDEPGAHLGPQVDDTQLNKLVSYIEKGTNEGAKVATGGERQDERGYFFQPTVFTGENPFVKKSCVMYEI